MMKHLFTTLILFLLSLSVSAQKDFQIEADTPYVRLQILCNDTAVASPTFGLGSWTFADSLIALFSDADWYLFGGTQVPNNTDGMYHDGEVSIGTTADRTGTLNVQGRIDARFGIDQVVIGASSGHDDMANSISIGLETISETPSDSSIAIGNRALRGTYDEFFPATNFGNTAIGFEAMFGAYFATNNTAIGINALRNASEVTDNVAIGNSVLRYAQDAQKNIGMGSNALLKNTSGSFNVAIGSESLRENLTGIYNYALGYQAMYNNTNGQFNNATGFRSLYNNTTGVYNTAMGYQSLYTNSTGGRNMAIGAQALYAALGAGNVAIGARAGYNTTGSKNIMVGDSSGYAYTGSNALFIENSASTTPLIFGDFAEDTLHVHGKLGFSQEAGNPDRLAGMNGTQLTSAVAGYGLVFSNDTLNVDTTVITGGGGGSSDADWYESGATPPDDIADEIYHEGDVHIGDATLVGSGKLNVTGLIKQYYPTTSYENIAIGEGAMSPSTTGTLGIALGQSALNNLTSGFANIGIGYKCGDAVLTGAKNIFIGYEAGLKYTGSNGIAMGNQAMQNNVSGSGCFAIGDRAFKTGTGANNFAIGNQALQSTTTGTGNFALGNIALNANTTGFNNLAIGQNAAQNGTTGSNNIYIGALAGFGASSNSAGDNTIVGAESGFSVDGNENVFIGRAAGYSAVGDGNVFLGNRAGFNETGSNKLYIENSNSASPLVLGDFAADSLLINGALGFTTTSGTATSITGRNGTQLTNIGEGYGITLNGSGDLEVDSSELATQYDLTQIPGDDWGSDVVNTDLTLTGDGTPGDPLKVDTSEIATQYDLTLLGGFTSWLLAASGTGGTEDITDGETVTITGAGINVATRSGSNVTITATEVDGSTTNEIQDITVTGASQPFTLDMSDDATDASFTGAGITTLTRTGNAITITSTEVDGSTTNELQTYGHAGTTSYTNTLSSGGGSFTLQAGGINSISHSAGTVTITATEVDGSTTNELNTIEENNSTVQTGNSRIDFNTLLDVTTDGAGEVNIDVDLSEATTVTTPESDDYVIMHDAGLNQPQKILYEDLYALITDGLEPDGNGIFSAANDGSDVGNTTYDVGIPGYLNFESNLLYLWGSVGRVGIGTNNPTYDLHLVGTQGAFGIEPASAGGTATLKLEGTSDGGGGNTNQANVIMNYTDTDYSGSEQTGAQISMNKESDASQWTTFKVTMPEATDADVMVAEKYGSFSNNTTESHIAFNGGVAFTQNYEWTSASGDLDIDRSYNIVNVSGSGTSSNEINLPEVASTSDNWDSSLSSTQCQVGQEYTISNFRSSQNLIVRAFSGDQVDAPGGTTVTIAAGESIIIKCVRWSGGVGYWKSYN